MMKSTISQSSIHSLGWAKKIDKGDCKMKKDFTVDKNSWHFRFINYFEHWDKQFYPEGKMPKDFCSYWSTFAGYVFRIFFTLALISAVLFLSFVLPAFIFSGIHMLLYYVGLSIFIACIVGMANYESHRNIFVMKFNSWKQKYCPGITYK